MTIPAILAPVFAQVALTFFLLLWMGGARLGSVRSRAVDVSSIALGQRAWPERVMQVSNAFHNQLELPILFYALVAFALITRKADLLFVVMSWVFVATRFAHAFVYATTNPIRQRFAIFVVGAVVLMVMWIIFAARMLIPGL
jgi:hypothetical protein